MLHVIQLSLILFFALAIGNVTLLVPLFLTNADENNFISWNHFSATICFFMKKEESHFYFLLFDGLILFQEEDIFCHFV